MIEYLLRFVSKLQPISGEEQENLLKRLLAALSKHTILIDDNFIPSGIKLINKFNEMDAIDSFCLQKRALSGSGKGRLDAR